MSMPNALKYILFVLYIIGATMALFFFFSAEETKIEKQNISPTSASPTNTAAASTKKTSPTDAEDNSTSATTNPTARFINKVHTGAGTATIAGKTNQRTLQLSSDFHTDAGPDLHVFLSNTANPQTSKELHDGEYVDLGALQNTNGEQIYTIPASVDFDIHSVVIYCVPFKVIFTIANFLPL